MRNSEKPDQKFQRLALLTGKEAARAISAAKVTVIGLGGVGSWCAEALARSGIGSLTLIDNDVICASNINRQIQALENSVGQSKAEVLANRLLEINPACNVKAITERFCIRGSLEETSAYYGINDADYVIDAIDSLSDKLDLIETAFLAGKTFFSSMGMANKLDPLLIRKADIWKTSGCVLAKRVRTGLKERGFKGKFTTVYSEEKRSPPDELGDTVSEKALGSSVAVTASAGMILASLVITSICDNTAASRKSHG